MTYTVKEMHYTLQGEGHHSGCPVVLVRFSGCNLWSGREEDRAKAVCKFCDTDFVGVGPSGGRLEAVELAARASHLWGERARDGRAVLLTGGEPMLQVDKHLIDVLHRWEFKVWIETNGTRAVPDSADWICVSPKLGAEVVQTRGQELKLVYPQNGGKPENYRHLSFAHWFLQPMDGPELERNTQAAAAYCLDHPPWRLGLQTHKLVGLQ